MGSFLEDFGKSGAPQAVSSLANLAVETGRQEAEGARGLAVTASDLAKFEETKAQNQFHNKLALAEEDRKVTEAKFKVEKLQADSDAMNAVTPVDTLLRNATPQTKQMLMDWGKQNGFIKDYGGGVLGIKAIHQEAAMKMMKQDTAFSLKLSDAHIQDLTGQSSELEQQLRELKDTKPDDKNIPVLEKRIAAVDLARKRAMTARNMMDEDLREKQLLKAEKWINVKDPRPDSQTGWMKQDPSTGEEIRNTEPPASAGANTPHTTQLEKGPDGKKTPGYQHTWAWDPSAKDFTKYVGPHGKTTGTATLTAAEAANHERAIKGYQSVITAKAALEKMAAGGVVPPTIAGQDPGLTAMLGMFAGKAIDKKTKDKLIAELEKTRLIRERQLKQYGYSTEMAAPPAAAGAAKPEWQNYLE